jgi:hypothetical protein
VSSAVAGGAAQRRLAEDLGSDTRSMSSMRQQLQEQLNQAAAQLGVTVDDGDAADEAGTKQHAAHGTPHEGSSAASNSSNMHDPHNEDSDADIGFYAGYGDDTFCRRKGFS